MTYEASFILGYVVILTITFVINSFRVLSLLNAHVYLFVKTHLCISIISG